MSASPLLAAFATIGCEGESGPATVELTDGTPPLCAPYVDDVDVFGYCLYSLAGGFPSEEEMTRQCSNAGIWEGECRHAWVAGRMKEQSGYDTEKLLAACGENDDCTFELLDFRPDPVLETQLSFCRKYAGKHHADCAGHAVQRWWLDAPTEEELNRLGAARSDYPDKVGFWIGLSKACWSEIKDKSCESVEADARIFCESALEKIEKDPLQCPSKIKKDMHGRGDRRGLVPAGGPAAN